MNMLWIQTSPYSICNSFRPNRKQGGKESNPKVLEIRQPVTLEQAVVAIHATFRIFNCICPLPAKTRNQQAFSNLSWLIGIHYLKHREKLLLPAANRKNPKAALSSLKNFLHNVVRFPDAGEISLYK